MIDLLCLQKIIFRYFTVPVISDYMPANDLCNDFGGILASITSESEMDNAIATCRDGISDNELSGCWIGLNKRSGNWEYIDGTNVRGLIGFNSNAGPITGKYPWDITEPNNYTPGELCVHLRMEKDFRWNDVACSYDNFDQYYRAVGLNIPLCVKNPTKSCGINTNNLKVWYKGGLNDISNNGNDAININGTINKDNNDCSVYGDANASFVIPYITNTKPHSIIYIAEYNGQKVIHHKNSEAINSLINIEINIFDNKPTNWKLYELMIFDNLLSSYQIECITDYLSQETGQLLSKSPTKSTAANTTISPTKVPTHNVQTTLALPSSAPTTMPIPITSKNTNKPFNLTQTIILTAGFTVLLCCLTILIVICIVSKRIYIKKNQEAIQKEKELASIGYNSNIGSAGISNDISNKSININESIVIKGIKQTKMCSTENNKDNKIETNDTQTVYLEGISDSIVYSNNTTKGNTERVSISSEIESNLKNTYINNEIITSGSNNQINNDEIISSELNANAFDIYKLTKGRIKSDEFITRK